MTYDEKTFQRQLYAVMAKITVMLEEKNRAYGDSALNPVRIFSKASSSEQILVRIDDKLSRLARGQAAGEDVYSDLLGYLVLYQIQKRREGNGFPEEESPTHIPILKFRGSVTDLATDICYELTQNEGQKLAEEILRFLSEGIAKFKDSPIRPHFRCPVTQQECDQPCVGSVCLKVRS